MLEMSARVTTLKTSTNINNTTLVPASKEGSLSTRNCRLVNIEAVFVSEADSAKRGQPHFAAFFILYKEEHARLTVHVNRDLQFILSPREARDQAQREVFAANGVLEAVTLVRPRPR